MADPYYSVLIQLGDPTFGDLQSWTVTHTGDPHAPDELAPITGLRFGWVMPDHVLWPLQPSPMTAAFAINVPQFADLAWVGEDTPVAIEVKLHSAADVAFAFYGRVTDATATPRRGRTGVTLGCVCVDYTVDLSRATYLGGAIVNEAESDALSIAFGAEPDLLGDVEPTWPMVYGPEVTVTNAPGLTYDNIILPILAQAVDFRSVPMGLGSDWALLILAPLVDATTRLPDRTSMMFVYDWAWKHAYQTRTIPAALLDRGSVTWTRNKRVPVTAINVHTVTLGAELETTGAPGNPFVTTAPVYDYRTVSEDLTRAEDLGQFYLRDDAADRRAWKLESVRYLLDQIDPAVFASTFPDDLMPKWTEAESEPTRSSCYNTLIELDGVEDHTNPYGATGDPTLRGLLSSVDFSLAGGRPALTLGFRDLTYDAPAAPAAFLWSGYAMHPYGSLAPAPA